MPKNVYISNSHLNVVEGGNVTLSADTFPVMSSYYTDRVSRYSLVSAPNHGRIVRTTADTFDPTIDFWSPKQLVRSQIMVSSNIVNSLKIYKVLIFLSIIYFSTYMMGLRAQTIVFL